VRNATPDGIDHLLVLVVATALAFDFTNGFHDSSNAVGTAIATGAAAASRRSALSGAERRGRSR
jgi:PiT family inorganic phosphate transporter